MTSIGSPATTSLGAALVLIGDYASVSDWGGDREAS